MGDGDERIEALRGRLAELKAQSDRIEEELKEVRRQLRECDSPSNMLIDLASRGPFTLPQAVEATGRRYDNVSVCAGELVRKGKLFRLGRGTYAAHPAPPVDLPEPAAVDLPPGPAQLPPPAPEPAGEASRPSRGRARATAPAQRDESTATESPREWMELDEEGLPEVTAPLGTAAWRFEMRARRDARRERELARREEADALHDPADPVLLDRAVGT